MKVGDKIKFNFAGSVDEGEIQEIYKEKNKEVGYYIYDGKYYYSINKEDVI